MVGEWWDEKAGGRGVFVYVAVVLLLFWLSCETHQERNIYSVLKC